MIVGVLFSAQAAVVSTSAQIWFTFPQMKTNVEPDLIPVVSIQHATTPKDRTHVLVKLVLLGMDKLVKVRTHIANE